MSSIDTMDREAWNSVAKHHHSSCLRWKQFMLVLLYLLLEIPLVVCGKILHHPPCFNLRQHRSGRFVVLPQRTKILPRFHGKETCVCSRHLRPTSVYEKISSTKTPNSYVKLNNPNSKKVNKKKSWDSRRGNVQGVESFGARMEEAEFVERLLSEAVEKVRHLQSENVYIADTSLNDLHIFPSVRHCNAALATFGDEGDYHRSLRLFTQMRKSASLMRKFFDDDTIFSTSHGRGPANENVSEGEKKMMGFISTQEESERKKSKPEQIEIDLVSFPPKPTLVTYSTLMSKAVSLGKPRVALRLWRLMRNQPNFYTNILARRQRDSRTKNSDFLDIDQLRKLEIEDSAIVPDVIFCNILMNAYAKLGDHDRARSVLNSMIADKYVGKGQLQDGIPPITPTVITYNTLADACKTAGELGEALDVLDLMTAHANSTGDQTIAPDAQTYTILISTCARKSRQTSDQRDVRSGGENDPDMAFTLLRRMSKEGIRPNGVTYCALIDVCSRCRRVDLALNGLRMMLKQKGKRSQPLFNEVGAWTAAINACGKAGRTDTATKLFRTMQRFGVKPNSVTCGCLTDCLLKSRPIKITETLEVLKYMKQEHLMPGEVMYTSLMDIALILAEKENKNVRRTRDGLHVQVIDKFENINNSLVSVGDDNEWVSNTTAKSIVLYTELMRSLMQDGDLESKRKLSEGSVDESNTSMLLKVFLVFQSLKAAGAMPDIACYNSLLRACAFAGDVERSKDILLRIEEEGLQPNDATWREALKAAAKASQSDFAESVWGKAVEYRKKGVHRTESKPWEPKVSDVELLMSVYAAEAQQTSNHGERIICHSKMIKLYEDAVSQSKERGMSKLCVEDLCKSQTFMLKALHAAVSYALAPRRKEDEGRDEPEKSRAKEIARDIAGLESLTGNPDLIVSDRKTRKAFQLAREWHRNVHHQKEK